MKLFHGTTAENYEKIKNEGFQEKPDSTWVCSGYGDTYFYSFSKIKKNNEYEDDESALMESIHLATGNAVITAALNNSKESYVVVLEFDIPKRFVKYIDNDTSCQGMNEAVCVCNEIANKFKISKIHKLKYYPMLRYFYLKSNISNNFLNIAKLAPHEYELFDKYVFPEDLIYDYEILE